MVLVSGGIESAALLAYWKHWDHAQHLLPLFIDYGQKNVRQEEAAQQVGRLLPGLGRSALQLVMHAASPGRANHAATASSMPQLSLPLLKRSPAAHRRCSALLSSRRLQAMCRHLGLDFNAINASMVAHQVRSTRFPAWYHQPRAPAHAATTTSHPPPVAWSPTPHALGGLLTLQPRSLLSPLQLNMATVGVRARWW